MRILLTISAALPFSPEGHPVFNWRASLPCAHFLGILFRRLAADQGHQEQQEDGAGNRAHHQGQLMQEEARRRRRRRRRNIHLDPQEEMTRNRQGKNHLQVEKQMRGNRKNVWKEQSEESEVQGITSQENKCSEQELKMSAEGQIHSNFAGEIVESRNIEENRVQNQHELQVSISRETNQRCRRIDRNSKNVLKLHRENENHGMSINTKQLSLTNEIEESFEVKARKELDQNQGDVINKIWHIPMEDKQYIN